MKVIKPADKITLVFFNSLFSLKRNKGKLIDKNLRWLYLGNDTSKYLHILYNFGCYGENVNEIIDLQNISKTLRNYYIDYIGSLSESYHSDSWWLASFPEKNQFISRVFLNICYLKIALSELESKEGSEHLVIFIDNRYLWRSLVKNIHLSGKYPGFERYTKDSAFYNFFEKAATDLKFTFNKLKFIINHSFKILVSKSIFRFNREIQNHTGNENILLISWVDGRSFKNSTYNDPYFGALYDYLKTREKNVIVVPQILPDLLEYYRVVKKISLSEDNFLVPESFLKFVDPIKITLSEIKKRPKKLSCPLFMNMEISDLIYSDFIDDWTGSRLSAIKLFSPVITAFHKAKLGVSEVIFTYENHNREKYLTLLFREWYPSSIIVGYQHASVSDMYLDHFYSDKEADLIPLPDRIITNGNHPKKLFVSSGYDENMVYCGPALRYDYIFETLKSKQLEKRISDKKRPTVLVVTSIDINDSTEMVYKAVKAFEDCKEYRVLIKCHPMLNFNRLKKIMKKIRIPLHFTVVDQPLNELLINSDVMIYTTTTACIEAMALGVPFVHLRSSGLRLDMDILEHVHDVGFSARTPEELRDMVEKILMINEERLNSERERWVNEVYELFEPLNEELFEKFII